MNESIKFHKQIKGYTQNRQPGTESMDPRPISELDEYKAVNCKVKLH